MPSKTFTLSLLFVHTACVSDTPGKLPVSLSPVRENPYPYIKSIPAPGGYARTVSSSTSFAAWLRDIPLKKNKQVFIYNGQLKANQEAQFAVLDISVGNKDLQQCADAVMRLRAEYLFAHNMFDSISFSDNSGHSYRFTRPFDRQHFNKYLEQVFGMCGSASLSKQLKHIPINEIKPGDVFIRGGFPGHAVIVADVVINNEGGKMYLLAQSFMPAQDIHILNNPSDASSSPWFKLNEAAYIITPEYIFRNNELKAWE